MKTDDARPLLEAAIQRIARRQEPEVRLVLSDALRQVGYDLTDLGHHEDALVVYEAVIHWLGNSPHPSLQPVLAQARVNRAHVIEAVDGPGAAIAAFEEVAAAYADAADPELQEAAARSMRGKARVLLSQGRVAEALAASRLVIERFADSHHDETLEQVGCAFNEAAHTALNLLELPDEGEGLLARSIELFGGRTGSPLRAHAINAHYNRGIVRAEGGDPQTALREWDQAISLWQSEPDTDLAEIQGAVARVLVAKGAVLRELGQIDEAARQYEIVLSYCDRTDDPEVAAEVCNAAHNLTAQALEFDGNVEACLPSLEDAVARSVGHEDDATSGAIAHALLTKAFAEWKIGMRDEAIATYDAVAELFASTPAVAAAVAEAMYNKALRLQELGRTQDALATYDRLIEELSASGDDAVREIVAAAEENRAEIRAESDHGG